MKQADRELLSLKTIVARKDCDGRAKCVWERIILRTIGDNRESSVNTRLMSPVGNVIRRIPDIDQSSPQSDRWIQGLECTQTRDGHQG